MINRLWKGHHPMKVIVLVFVFLLTLELPSLAVWKSDLSRDSSPLETVTTFFADWNMGEIRAASKLFDQEPSVTDAFPRFHWQGKKAFREWFSDLDIYNQSQGFTDYDFEVGTPLTNDVEGKLANVIVPVVLNLKHDGRPESFTGLVNVVLQRNRSSWKISAFTWTDNQPG